MDTIFLKKIAQKIQEPKTVIIILKTKKTKKNKNKTKQTNKQNWCEKKQMNAQDKREMSETQTTLKKTKKEGGKKEWENIEKDKRQETKEYVCCGARGSFVQNI